MQKAHAEGKVVLLIIDEAHRLSERLLEEIRLLSNMELEGKKLVNIFFVGQNELKDILRCPQFRAQRQRITLFYDIEPLTEDETREYMMHRLKIAGTGEQLFSRDAIYQIHNFTQGYPRLINILSGRSMLTGYVMDQKKIDGGIVKECIREMRFQDPQISADQPSREQEYSRNESNDTSGAQRSAGDRTKPPDSEGESTVPEQYKRKGG